MKTSKLILAAASVLILFLWATPGFSQGNSPLEDKNNGVFKVKSKAEMAKNLDKLNKKGKAEYEKAKNELKKIKNPTFELAPNEVLNKNPKELLGLMPMNKQDEDFMKKQNLENKKNEKKILQGFKDAGLDASSYSFTNYSISINTLTLDPFLSCSWNKSILTPVRNQSSCGSCWAFAAAAAFEHSYNKFYGSVSSPVDLSEQQILACGKTSSGLDAGSCSGGYTNRALDYIKWHGVTLEPYYRYTATSSPCNSNSYAVKAGSFGTFNPAGRFPTVSEIKALINLFGAVTTSMKAGLSSFFSYGGGVYNGYPSNSTETDHAVIIVGWCDNLNAWIIKNSWGTNWGPYGGYAYVGYDQCNIGRKRVCWVYPNKIQN
ncbi:C1 family peptidase [Snuella lapsa]|uniref:Peptidase C1A papain C-terminal domain-containing protein n=1 Tax=Snuella lapsa TaxID=870481 RepID=A0ABP6Y249_9FLAO